MVVHGHRFGQDYSPIDEEIRRCSHQVLPRLEKLLLDFCETTDGLLATMISSRWYDNEISPGLLRWAIVSPKKTFGSIDNHFFNTHKLY
jgi:hypothetical protein